MFSKLLLVLAFISVPVSATTNESKVTIEQIFRAVEIGSPDHSLPKIFTQTSETKHRAYVDGLWILAETSDGKILYLVSEVEFQSINTSYHRKMAALKINLFYDDDMPKPALDSYIYTKSSTIQVQENPEKFCSGQEETQAEILTELSDRSYISLKYSGGRNAYRCDTGAASNSTLAKPKRGRLKLSKAKLGSRTPTTGSKLSTSVVSYW